MHLQPLSRKRNKDKNHRSQFFFLCTVFVNKTKSNRCTFSLHCFTFSLVYFFFFFQNLKHTKAEAGLPTSDFRFPTFDFQVPTSHFQLPTSKAQLPLDPPRGSRSRLSGKSGCTVLARGDPGRSSHKRERLKLLL